MLHFFPRWRAARGARRRRSVFTSLNAQVIFDGFIGSVVFEKSLELLAEPLHLVRGPAVVRVARAERFEQDLPVQLNRDAAHTERPFAKPCLSPAPGERPRSILLGEAPQDFE